jgi:high-affinity iron transporter
MAVAAACLAGLGLTARPPQACPAPRAALWAGVRDSLWPLLTHQGGDPAWAHLEPGALPGASASWCNPLGPDPAARAAGHAIYAQHCASCHGEQGRGDGPGAGVADPAPYDFTKPEFAGMREPPGPAVLYAIVTRGIDSTAMRAFGGTLGPWERLAVLAYIAELPGPEAVRASRAWADSLRLRRRN